MGQTAFISFLSKQEETEPLFKSFPGLKFINGLGKTFENKPSDFVIILEPKNFEELTAIKNNKELLKYLKGILVKDSYKESSALPYLLSELKLSTFTKYLLDVTSQEVLERIVWAWSVEGQAELIADARLVGDRIFIQSCSFDRFFVPVGNIKPLSKLSEKELKKFKIDKHGRFLHWEGQDIHLDLEAFRVANDPDLKARIKEKSLKFDKKFGEAITAIRKEHHLNQTDLGISDKQLRRYEHGEQRPTFKAYKVMAESHKLSLGEYIDKLSKKYQELSS